MQDHVFFHFFPSGSEEDEKDKEKKKKKKEKAQKEPMVGPLAVVSPDSLLSGCFCSLTDFPKRPFTSVYLWTENQRF